MARNNYDKLADKLLKQKDKGDSLKKFNIDLNKVLGGGIDNKKIEQNHHQKLIDTTKTCLNTQYKFWTDKQYGDHSARINDIKRDIRTFELIISSNTFTSENLTKLKDIKTKHGCN